MEGRRECKRKGSFLLKWQRENRALFHETTTHIRGVPFFFFSSSSHLSDSRARASARRNESFLVLIRLDGERDVSLLDSARARSSSTERERPCVAPSPLSLSPLPTWIQKRNHARRWAHMSLPSLRRRGECRRAEAAAPAWRREASSFRQVFFPLFSSEFVETQKKNKAKKKKKSEETRPALTLALSLSCPLRHYTEDGLCTEKQRTTPARRSLACRCLKEANHVSTDAFVFIDGSSSPSIHSPGRELEARLPSLFRLHERASKAIAAADRYEKSSSNEKQRERGRKKERRSCRKFGQTKRIHHFRS